MQEQLAVLNTHFRTFGYVIDAPSDSTERATLWATIVAKVMAIFQ